MSNFKSVTFGSGLPISVDSLNQLQNNIAQIQSEFKIADTTVNATVGDIQKSVTVRPTIFAETLTLEFQGNRAVRDVNFGGTNFTNFTNTSQFPVIMVASVASDVSAEDGMVCRATALGSSSGRIEVFKLTASKKTQVRVSYIALQLKEVQ